MRNKKSTPITMEMFDEAIMPRFEEIMDNKIKIYRDEVLGFKLEVLDEIQKLRDEVTVALHQYQRTNRRVDLIDQHLHISTANLD